MADYKIFDVDRHGSGAVSYDLRFRTARFRAQMQKAQFKLDTLVMADMKPYMPMDKGNFINSTSAMSAALAGTGQVVAGAPPQGRYLYMGKLMVDEETGSPFARKGARKVLVSQYSGKSLNKNLSEDLHFRKGQPHWFEAAKEAHGAEWLKIAKEEGGGGD